MSAETLDQIESGCRDRTLLELLAYIVNGRGTTPHQKQPTRQRVDRQAEIVVGVETTRPCETAASLERMRSLAAMCCPARSWAAPLWWLGSSAPPNSSWTTERRRSGRSSGPAAARRLPLPGTRIPTCFRFPQE